MRTPPLKMQEWLDAQRDVNTKKADQVTALEAHVGRMKELERAAQNRFNNGKGRAIKILQAAVGAAVDGALGPETIGLVDAADRVQTMQAMLDAREQLYRGIAANRPASEKFLTGWLNRNNALRKFVGL